MTFTQTCVIAANRSRVWLFLLDVENVARCLPGVEQLKRLAEDTYEGTLKLKIGPITLALKGVLKVESRDNERYSGVMRADAKDSRLGGGVRARLGMDLLEKSEQETQMDVTLEAHVLGKIGEFGQPMMKKKADAMLADFARQVSAKLASEPGGVGTTAEPQA
jgi:carbon monoxide dehydrogenase subunit G